jgi:adenylate cyclase
MSAALTEAVGKIPTSRSGSQVPMEFRHGADLIVTNIRAFELGGGKPWFITVMMPVDEVDGPIHRATRDTLVVSAIFLALGVTIAVWFSGAITKPVRIMSEDLRRVGELRLSSTPPARSFIDELDTLGKTLAAMKAGLRSFARYVLIELVRATLSSGRDVESGGETRVVTVLFTDIEGFTRIAEALSPEDLSRDLGRYFDALESVITDAGGLIDKFMGDGAMALFNAPVLLPGHAARACEAALKLQVALETFNLEREAQGQAPFRTRIGLALGPAMVGNIGGWEGKVTLAAACFAASAEKAAAASVIGNNGRSPYAMLDKRKDLVRERTV